MIVSHLVLASPDILLFSQAALEQAQDANRTMNLPPHQPPSGFNNLFSTIGWVYGAAHLIVAGVKAFKLRRQTVVEPSGVKIFVVSGAALFLSPFAVPFFGLTILSREMAWFIGLLVGVFLPWLLLIFRKDLRHLRRQGVIGFCVSLLAPVALVTAVAIFV